MQMVGAFLVGEPMIKNTDRLIYALLAFALGWHAISSDYTPLSICSGMNSCSVWDRP